MEVSHGGVEVEVAAISSRFFSSGHEDVSHRELPNRVCF